MTPVNGKTALSEQALLRKVRAGALMQTLTTNVYYWVDGPNGTPQQVPRDTSSVIDGLVSARLVRLGQSFSVKFGLNTFRFAALELTHTGRHAVAAHATRA